MGNRAVITTKKRENGASEIAFDENEKAILAIALETLISEQSYRIKEFIKKNRKVLSGIIDSYEADIKEYRQLLEKVRR